MSHEHPQESRRSSLGWFGLVVFLPLLYVLSIGPVGAMAFNNPKAIDGLRKFYAPVIWLHDHTPVKKPLETYVELWGFP